MTRYSDHIAQDRRLVILRILAEDRDYSVNCSVMQMALKGWGHGESRDVVRGDFAWLAEQGLVSVEALCESVHVAKLTPRGHDVAKGVASVPGVKRPGPEG
ncbi:MAG: ArsR family transcriptional regulator [Alphaproteobacteria bacterium]|nr:ArsR family transcriptional regulator [Alphaproteobacteria bacterium]